jgi:hypothetical protein
VRFGYRFGENGVLVPHEASKSRSARWLAYAAGKPLRAIAEACRRWGHRISHEGVACVLRAAGDVEARGDSAPYSSAGV